MTEGPEYNTAKEGNSDFSEKGCFVWGRGTIIILDRKFKLVGKMGEPEAILVTMIQWGFKKKPQNFDIFTSLH